MSVEDGSDELWVEVKCQSNSEIAGSPRNSFRASLRRSIAGVEHWMGKGASRLPTPTKLRIPPFQSLGVRLRGLSFVVKRETARTVS